MRIGVILPNWIGDVVMATPALRAISDHFRPGGTILGLMRPHVAGVLDGTNWVDRRVYFDPYSGDRELHSWSVGCQLRRLRLDALVMLTNSLRAASVAWLSGARRRIGYVRYGRGPLLTDKLYPPRRGLKLTPVSAVDYYLELATLLGCRETSRKLELRTTDEEEGRADRVWVKLGLSGDDEVVAICPGSARGPAKSWPASHFADLARRLADTLDCKVLVICGPAEQSVARSIARMSERRQVVSLAGHAPSIGLSKVCLRRSRLAITNDSGPRHLAAGFGVPTVALFGATDPRWSINYNTREIQLSEDVACAPCGKRICPLGHHRCLQDLSVDRVLAATRRLWHEAAARRPMEDR